MNMMPENSRFTEKYNCKNVAFSEYVTVDNDFEIFGKISDGEIIKTITGKEPK